MAVSHKKLLIFKKLDAAQIQKASACSIVG